MKPVLFLAALLVMAVSIGAQSGATATYVDHEKVAAGGTLATGADYSVSINKRTAAGQVEVHDKETDTIYMLDGEATFVTGGTMIGGRVSRPNQQLGTDINGGQTHHLTKGDVVVVPAGMPHWFKEVPKPVTYYVVKVIKP
jgi:quercetin dioxygenase-like cupin family protein